MANEFAQAFRPILPDWTRLWLIKPDRTLGWIIDDFADGEVDILAFGQGQLTLRLHRDSRACDVEYDGDTARALDFLNFGVNFYYRDPGNGSQKRFMGIRSSYEKGWSGNERSAFYTVTFRSALAEILSRRMVMVEGGGRYEYTETPDNVLRNIIGAQVETGKVVQPADVPWDRTRFGPSGDPWTVTVEDELSPGDFPDEIDYVVDHGTGLNAVMLELCNAKHPDTKEAFELWPYLEEDNPGEFHIVIRQGRSGVSRTIGADKSEIVYAPERQAVTAWRKKVDGESKANCLAVRGEVRGWDGYEQYEYDTTEYDKEGAIEDSWRLPEATTEAEMQMEALTYLQQLKRGATTIEVEIVERPGMQYGIDVEEGDLVTFSSGAASFDEVDAYDILGVRIRFPAPGFPKVSFVVGQFQRNALADRARHGGGGGRGGGGGGGGRPRQKTGSDPGCFGYHRIVDGNEEYVEADSCGAAVQLLGEKLTDVLRVVESAEADNAHPTADVFRLEIRADAYIADPSPTRLVPVTLASGGTIWLLATTVPPPTPSP